MAAARAHVGTSEPAERAAALSAELKLWAFRYASHGTPIFPCQANKRPFTKRGFKDATTNLEQIGNWWRAWPLAMIGMPTGVASGLVVVDVDVKNGANGFETILNNGWDLPANALEIITPSGGSHFYFQIRERQIVGSSAGRIGPGIDVRGEGGYVILPPSRPRLDGPDYQYAEGQTLGDIQIRAFTW